MLSSGEKRTGTDGQLLASSSSARTLRTTGGKRNGSGSSATSISGRA